MGDDGGDWTADVAEGPRHEAWQGTGVARTRGVAGAVGDVEQEGVQQVKAFRLVYNLHCVLKH